MKITDFRKIPQFPHCPYRVDVPWTYLEKHIEKAQMEINLNLNPDFQRAHVWSTKQQIDYCEYILRNGTSGRELYFNCPGWMGNFEGPYLIVDGKQRLNAVRRFMAGEIQVFGSSIHKYKNEPDTLIASFSWNIAALKTRREVLQWYINFNSGGTSHTDEEIQKVKDLLDKEMRSSQTRR